MNIGTRLEAVAALVPQGAILADIGTDHAYLPVYLLERKQIMRAIAGDIAEGPCQAARVTVGMHGLKNSIEVRKGSGLEVLTPGEADCVTICGMGGSTMISILEDSMDVALATRTLVLQPMAGAPSLRKWLVEHGWRITAEDLVDDAPHFYEIMQVERGESTPLSELELLVGPVNLAGEHPLLAKHVERQIAGLEQVLASMGKSESARQTPKYAEMQAQLAALEGWKTDKTLSVAKVVGILEAIAPPSLAMDWDNVGLLLGRKSKSVERILVALDMTAETVAQAVDMGADLLITHHPVIFKKLPSLVEGNWQQDLLLTLAEHGCAAYSMHTNYDCADNGVNAVLARVLGLENIAVLDEQSGLGRIGTLAEAMPLPAYASSVKMALLADYVTYASATGVVKNVAVCGGAGADLVHLALAKGVDTLVTGDVKYHEAQEAAFSGLNIVDAGHQATERLAMRALAARLRDIFKRDGNEVEVQLAQESLLLKSV